MNEIDKPSVGNRERFIRWVPKFSNDFHESEDSGRVIVWNPAFPSLLQTSDKTATVVYTDWARGLEKVQHELQRQAYLQFSALSIPYIEEMFDKSTPIEILLFLADMRREEENAMTNSGEDPHITSIDSINDATIFFFIDIHNEKPEIEFVY